MIAGLAGFGVACSDSGSGASSSGVTNLGYYADQLEQGDGLIAFRADEGQPDVDDGHDGNGDGDDQDSILFVHDLRTGRTTSLGMAISELDVDGRTVAFAVWEGRDGARDLNGDGDDDDFVLHVYDADSGSVRSTHTAVEQGFTVDGDLIAFVVDEQRQGQQDLNGDGDALDFVAHLHHVSSGLTTNLAIKVNTHPVVHDDVVGVAWREEGTDLNGDGDSINDDVLHVIDGRTGAIVNLGLAVDSDPLPDTPFLAIDAGQVLFAGLELLQDADLNGDGDLNDRILHVYDVATGRLDNLEMENLGAWRSLRSGTFMNLVREESIDLNADGDLDDLVMHAYDIDTRALTNLGVASNDIGRREGEHFFFQADEFLQGSDLNGDGDLNDWVVHTYVGGRLVNIGVSTGFQPDRARQLDPEQVILAVDEPGQGGSDLNGDGDFHDVVLHRWSELGGLENLGIPGVPLSAAGRHLLLTVYEEDEDLDGNGNTGTFEPVFHVLDLDTGKLRNLGLTVGPLTTFDAPRELRDGAYPLLVDEFGQRADLNGDGIWAGSVLHIVRVP